LHVIVFAKLVAKAKIIRLFSQNFQQKRKYLDNFHENVNFSQVTFCKNGIKNILVSVLGMEYSTPVQITDIPSFISS
jgi:hypothetical protein